MRRDWPTTSGPRRKELAIIMTTTTNSRAYHRSSTIFGCTIFLLVVPSSAISENIYYGGPAMNEEDVDTKFRLQPFCMNQLCSNQDDCCTGTVCVAYRSAKIGICAKPLSQVEGKACLTTARSEPHCRHDLVCKSIHKDFHPLGLCTNANAVQPKKKYFDPCYRTIECDTQQQLCCRAQRSPGRTTDRKICSYFDDPLEQCIF